MPTGSQGRRGRPKGSGLDDRAQLAAILELLAQDPSLRPTTAIKRLGVTDPSTIRRLRDKLRLSRDGGASTAAPKAKTEPKPVSVPHARKSVPEAVKPAQEVNQAETPKAQKPEPAKPSATAPEPERGEDPSIVGAPLPEAQQMAELVAQCMTIGMQAWLRSAEVQQLMLKDMASLPHVRAALRAQIDMLKIAKSYYSSVSKDRK